MDMLEPFVVHGVPLIAIVFALVEEVKAWGVQGKILRGVALLVGFGLALLYQVAMQGVPVGLSGWFLVVIVGLFYGLTASGAYNFLDSRFPKV